MPAQEYVPLDKKTHLIGKIKLINGKVRKIFPKLELLIDLCIAKDLEKEQWAMAMGHFRESMKIILKKEDLTNQEIFTYQQHADMFFKYWLALYGEEGITNYVHLVGSGHIGEYLFHWKSLYVHSQQGWEAFNALFKSFYFSRTQRGGATNRGLGDRSRLKPVAKWLQRRLVFLMGHSIESIKEHLSSRTAEDKGKDRQWVKNSGGSIEFGQLIRSDSESSSDSDASTRVEDDWDIGSQELYQEWDDGKDQVEVESSEESNDEDWW